MFHRVNTRNRFQRGKKTIHASKYINKAQSNEIVEKLIIKNKFSDFPISQVLKKNIQNRGYNIPTPIQDQTIPHILNGSDVVGIANTGTGKTAAFLIPLIHKITLNRSEKVLIVVPTRELAIQINDELTELAKFLNVTSVLCIGGANINQQLSGLKRNPNMIIATPGRLKDIIWRGQLNLSNFKNIVLDEVDRMVDIGFIKDIKFIISLLPGYRQSLFFSATVSPEISGIVQSFLRDPVTISVKVKETAVGIDQDVVRVKDKYEKIKKLQLMLKQNEYKKVLIFGRTKWSVEKLSQTLKQNGFKADSIHGNKSQNQRLRALYQFKQNRLQVLVATDIASRGLDIDDVSHVINFDEPTNYTDYIHRIGRTGRAEKQGKALTFVV